MFIILRTVFNRGSPLQEKKWELSEINLEKRRYLSHYRSQKGFKGTVVNQALPSLHEGSLENTLTVP